MEPLYQNLLAAASVVVYVKVLIGTCDYGVSQKWLGSKVSRKIIHIGAGSWVLFWPLFTTDHWTWQLNILVPAIYSVQLFVKGAITRDREDPDVKTMTRTGDPTELLFGPLFFTLIMNLVGLYCFRDASGIFIMACLGFGDGIAPLVGGYFPYGRYPTYPFGPSDKKTLSGSLGFFVSSIVGYYSLKYVLDIGTTDYASICSVVAVATATEGISGGLDNPVIALSAYIASQYLVVSR